MLKIKKTTMETGKEEDETEKRMREMDERSDGLHKFPEE